MTDRRTIELREAAERLLRDAGHAEDVIRKSRQYTDERKSGYALTSIAVSLAAFLRYTATATIAGLDMAEGLVPDGR